MSAAKDFRDRSRAESLFTEYSARFTDRQAVRI